MSDRQIAGVLGEDHLTDIDVATAPFEDLQAAGIDVAVEAVHPVVSQKANEQNSSYLVVQATLTGDETDHTAYLCHCWDFVARRFPDHEALRAGDLAQLGNCKHVERVKRDQGEDGLRAEENQGLDEFAGEDS